MNIERIQPGSWNSRAVVHGDLVFLSGIVADDKSLSMKGQTEQVLAKIDEVLAAAGTDKSRILTSTVYLADIDAKGRDERSLDGLDRQGQPAGAGRHRHGAHAGHPGRDHGLRGEVAPPPRHPGPGSSPGPGSGGGA